jgi:hypothetical protein
MRYKYLENNEHCSIFVVLNLIQTIFKCNKIIMEANDNQKEVVRPSFRAAFDRLPRNKVSEVRERIKKVLNAKTDKTFYDCMAGTREAKISEAQAIEAIFVEYGIVLMWGEV